MCRRKDDGQELEIVLVNMENPSIKLVTTGDLAAFEPTNKFLAVVQKTNLEINSLTSTFTFGETIKQTSQTDIKLLRWINADTIGFVTSSAVYNWNVIDSSPPKRIFVKSTKA